MSDGKDMQTPDRQPEGIRLSPEEKLRQAKRNRAIGIAVAGLCVLFYLITVFKMGPSILSRPM